MNPFENKIQSYTFEMGFENCPKQVKCIFCRGLNMFFQFRRTAYATDNLKIKVLLKRRMMNYLFFVRVKT